MTIYTKCVFTTNQIMTNHSFEYNSNSLWYRDLHNSMLILQVLYLSIWNSWGTNLFDNERGLRCEKSIL